MSSPAESQHNHDIKVLCITGAARSGSTILANILGQYPGFFTVGETHQLWTAGLVDQRLCGCGRKLTECRVWSAVFEEGFGSLGKVDFARVQLARDHCSRTRGLLLSHVPVRKGKWEHDRAEYLRAVEQLYAAIVACTGCKVIVDTSKLPMYGYLLNASTLVQPYIVHLVRDPRATAYSWLRRKPVRTAKGTSHMPSRGVLRSALEWSVQNATTEVLKAHAFPRAMTLLYEDFVAEPHESVKAIVRFTGEPVPDSPVPPSGVFTLGVTHTVVGNPNRFETGAVSIREDAEWKSGLNPRDKAVINAVCWPWLIRYRYARNKAHG